MDGLLDAWFLYLKRATKLLAQEVVEKSKTCNPDLICQKTHAGKPSLPVMRGSSLYALTVV